MEDNSKLKIRQTNNKHSSDKNSITKYLGRDSSYFQKLSQWASNSRKIGVRSITSGDIEIISDIYKHLSHAQPLPEKIVKRKGRIKNIIQKAKSLGFRSDIKTKSPKSHIPEKPIDQRITQQKPPLTKHKVTLFRDTNNEKISFGLRDYQARFDNLINWPFPDYIYMTPEEVLLKLSKTREKLATDNQISIDNEESLKIQLKQTMDECKKVELIKLEAQKVLDTTKHDLLRIRNQQKELKKQISKITENQRLSVVHLEYAKEKLKSGRPGGEKLYDTEYLKRLEADIRGLSAEKRKKRKILEALFDPLERVKKDVKEAVRTLDIAKLKLENSKQEYRRLKTQKNNIPKLKNLSVACIGDIENQISVFEARFKTLSSHFVGSSWQSMFIWYQVLLLSDSEFEILLKSICSLRTSCQIWGKLRESDVKNVQNPSEKENLELQINLKQRELINTFLQKQYSELDKLPSLPPAADEEAQNLTLSKEIQIKTIESACRKYLEKQWVKSPDDLLLIFR